jgi:hypothetical protein
LAKYCGGTGVTLNSAAANRSKISEKEFFKSVRPSSLIKRFETPHEIARLVTFFLQSSRLSHQRERQLKTVFGRAYLKRHVGLE